MEKIVFIAFVMLLFLWSNVKRKKGWINPSTLLIIIYTLAMILAIPHLLINESTGIKLLLNDSKYWQGSFSFIFYLLLFLYPLWYFKENKVENIILPNIKILNITSTILIIFLMYSLLFNLPVVYKIFTGGIDFVELRNNLESTRDMYANDEGILNTIANLAAEMYPFAILLFYIYYIIGGHKLRCTLLLISSTAIIIQVLTYIGRDGVIFWMFAFVFMYFVFSKYLNIKQKKYIKITFIIGFLLSLIPFILISMSRFGDNETGTGGALLAYIGHMPANYCLFFNLQNHHINYGISFPIFWRIIGQSMPVSEGIWEEGGTCSYVFATFIKGFNINFGMFGTILVGLLMNLAFINIFGKMKRYLYFYYFFIYILYFQILSQGVFYFHQYMMGGNFFIVICIFLYFFYKNVQRNNDNFILKKKNDDF